MDFLKKISNVPGVCGFEHRAQQMVASELEPHAEELWTDRLGNLIALKGATNPPNPSSVKKLIYTAHIDEIGFMVRHIDERGFVRFAAVGGFDPRTLPSQRVTIHGTKDGERTIQGVIAPQPPWLSTDEDRKRVLPLEELFIDTGLTGETVRGQVDVGDIISLSKEFEILNEDVITGRNFDDRVGIYCLVEAFKRIVDSTVDVYAVSAVQEELGTRGIPTAAHAIAADIGVAIDGSLPADIPYAKTHQEQCALGGGTGIYMLDNRTLGDPELIRGLVDTCKRHDIAYQRELGGGTDASIIQRSGLGAKCTTIGAPTRYMHSTVQMCHVDDIEATIQLLTEFPKYAAGILPPSWK